MMAGFFFHLQGRRSGLIGDPVLARHLVHWMPDSRYALFQSRIGMVHFWLILRSARYPGANDREVAAGRKVEIGGGDGAAAGGVQGGAGLNGAGRDVEVVPAARAGWNAAPTNPVGERSSQRSGKLEPRRCQRPAKVNFTLLFLPSSGNNRCPSRFYENVNHSDPFGLIKVPCIGSRAGVTPSTNRGRPHTQKPSWQMQLMACGSVLLKQPKVPRRTSRSKLPNALYKTRRKSERIKGLQSAQL
jgi:hypothetical protein